MTLIVNGTQYRAEDLAKVILKKHPDIRQSQRYKDCKDMCIDITMSCDKQEQVQSMIGWMKQAVRDDINAKKNGKSESDRLINSIHYLVSYDLL